MADNQSYTILQALQPGGALSGTLTGIAAVYGLMQLSNALGGGQAPQKKTFRQARPPKWRGYGECKKAGPLAFFGYDTGQNRLWMVPMVHHGEMQGIVAHFFGDERLKLVGGDGPDFSSDADVVTDPGHFRDGGRWCRIDFKSGADDQEALERLNSHISNKWTTNHRLAGIASVLIDLLSPDPDDFDGVFTHGLPEYSCIGRFSRVFDPRDAAIAITSFDAAGVIHTTTAHGLQGPHTDTNGKKFPGDFVFVQGVGPIKSGRYYVRTAPTTTTLTLRSNTDADLPFGVAGTGGSITKCKYSMNLALCALDYMSHPSGMDLPWELFQGALGTTSVTDWSAQANICDVVMTTKDGGTEPYLAISGGYQLTERPVDVLSKILRVGDARVFLRGDGYIGLDVAKFEEPDVWLTDDDILDWSGFQRSRDPAEIKNVINAKYTSVDQNYEEADADPWRVDESIDANGEHSTDLDLTFSRSHPTARARMKVESYRGDPEWSGTIVTNANGMKCWTKRLIGIDSARHGFRLVFEVLEIPAFDIETGNCTLSISAMPIEATDRNPSVDEGTAPVADSYSELSSEFPAGFKVTVSGGKINAVWDASFDTGAHPYLQHRPHDENVTDDDATWTDFATKNESARTAQSAVLTAGKYDAKMKFDYGLWIYIRSIIVS